MKTIITFDITMSCIRYIFKSIYVHISAHRNAFAIARSIDYLDHAH